MLKKNTCPECGSNEIGRGKFYGSSALIPAHKRISFGSTVFALVCTNCGFVIQLQVEKPRIFRESK